MFRRAFLAASLCFATSTAALADFSYEQSSKVTGGAMAGMMKLAGAFSKAAREPMTSTVIVKGDRMAHLSPSHISIIDVKNETITDIDPQKKTYSVITFADMTKAMQRMSEKVNEKAKDEHGEITYKASVKETGEKKVISGFNTKEVILTITAEGTDKKSGQQGAMNVVSSMWMAPKVPGYEEVSGFYKRMGEKMAWTPGAGGLAMQRGDMMKGMGQLAKESAKLEGIPVLQIMRMGGAADGAAPRPQAQTKEEPPAPKAGEVAGSAIAGRLGGLAGGLGGFGRKKKPAEEQPAQQTQSSSSGTQSADSSASLIEMTTEMSSFSTAGVDTSKFEVPAGFKQVESQMQKALR
jgi:hypothetical protein